MPAGHVSRRRNLLWIPGSDSPGRATQSCQRVTTAPASAERRKMLLRPREPHQREAAFTWRQRGKSACGARGASWAVVPVMHCGCTSVTVTLARVCSNSRAPVIFCRAAAHLRFCRREEAGKCGDRKETRRFIPVATRTRTRTNRRHHLPPSRLISWSRRCVNAPPSLSLTAQLQRRRLPAASRGAKTRRMAAARPAKELQAPGP